MLEQHNAELSSSNEELVVAIAVQVFAFGCDILSPGAHHSEPGPKHLLRTRWLLRSKDPQK